MKESLNDEGENKQKLGVIIIISQETNLGQRSFSKTPYFPGKKLLKIDFKYFMKFISLFAR